MSPSAIKQLTRVEQLFDESKLDEALELLNDKNQFEGLKIEEISHLRYLKGLILVYQNKGLELIELGELILKEGRNLKQNLLYFDGLFFVAHGLDLERRFETAISIIGQAETLLGHLSDVPKKVINRRKFRLNVLKTMVDIHMGKMDSAEKSLEDLLCIQGEIDITWELLWALTNIAYIKLIWRAEFDIALEYTKKAMHYAKKIKFNHFWIGYCLLGIGVINMQKCEYEMSLKNHMKSLEYFKQINNYWYVANIYNNLGGLYSIKGEYNTALQYLEEAKSLWEQYPLSRDWCLDTLIWVSLENGDDKRAQKYFQLLEELYSENPSFEEIYKINKARLLKRSFRIRDKANVESLLKEIIKRKSVSFEIKISAYVNFCELLLEEYRLNNNPEVLDELKQYITDLLDLAKNSHSYFVFCNAFILQSKLALLNLDIKTARRFLTQAQKIAESYGIKSLAMRISYEHDELIKQSKMWKSYKTSETPISERWKLAGLSEQMEKMVKNRIVDFPDIKNEEPVLLLIISKDGVPIFTQSFIKDNIFGEYLFGAFFAAFNSFMDEEFSEGLDRASFGEYTLLMKAITPFLICYVYKGQSYSAQTRIKMFIEKLQDDKEVWEIIGNFFTTNKIIQKDTIPRLDSLIREIFVTRNPA